MRGHGLRDGPAQALRHVWMAARPVEHPIEQALSLRGAAAGRLKSSYERSRLRGRKVGEDDAAADVEWRHPRVHDQVGGRGHPKKAEREPAVERLLGAAIVALANRRKKLIHRKRKRAYGVNLVYEDDQLSAGCIRSR